METEEITKIGNESQELFMPDHGTLEDASTLRKGERLLERVETNMKRYPWVVLTMGAGLGYMASQWRRQL
ncbi:MAG TPA: hypothetical protein VIT63_04795 [Nitrospira sp.]